MTMMIEAGVRFSVVLNAASRWLWVPAFAGTTSGGTSPAMTSGRISVSYDRSRCSFLCSFKRCEPVVMGSCVRRNDERRDKPRDDDGTAFAAR